MEPRDDDGVATLVLMDLVAPPGPVARGDETAWLIEHADSEPARSLYFVSADQWTHAHDNACKFGTREDAVRIAGRHRVAEHMWCAPPEPKP